jgi:hypothetical protein
MTPFVLGMTRRQLSAAIGDPSSIELLSFGAGSSKERWLYATHRVEVSFSEDHEWRLSSVSVDNPDATIRGIRFIGCPAERLFALAESVGIDDVVQDGEHGIFGTCYGSERFGLQFWEHKGRVVRITLFPGYDESGNAPM